MAQEIPSHEKPLLRDCCNHKRNCTLVSPHLTIAAGISSSSFVSMGKLTESSLPKEISSTPIFHESICTDGTRTRNHIPKASVSIELDVSIAAFIKLYLFRIRRCWGWTTADDITGVSGIFKRHTSDIISFQCFSVLNVSVFGAQVLNDTCVSLSKTT